MEITLLTALALVSVALIVFRANAPQPQKLAIRARR